MEVDVLELGVARHEEVIFIDLQSLRLSFGEVNAELFEILTEPFVFFLETASAYETAGFLVNFGWNRIFRLHRPLELRPILHIFGHLSHTATTLTARF